MKSPSSPGANTQGIFYLLAALAFLTVSDAIIKWLSPDLPLHEIMLWRALFALSALLVFVYFRAGLKTLKTRRPLLHLARGAMLVLANMFFFTGLAAMPFAENIALFFTAPLFICILSQPVLGEKVSLSRWLAILIGLAGVVIMLRPGSDLFRVIGLLPVMAALSYAMMTMMTRKLGIEESAAAMTFYIQLAFIAISIPIGLTIGDGSLDRYQSDSLSFLLRAWRLPDLQQIQLLLLCGVMVSIGGYLLSQAYRLGEASIVAPFEYTSMPYALAVGYLLWGDWPDWVSMIGSGLIICGGLLVIYLENRERIRASRPAQIDY